MMKRAYIVSVVYIVCFCGYLMSRYDNPYSFLSGQIVVNLSDKTVWCMMFFPVWALGVWIYDKNWKQANIVIYRYYSVLKWWNRIGVKSVLLILTSYLSLCLEIVLLYSTDLTYEKIHILGCLILHAVLLLLIGLLLGLVIKNSIYVGVTLILIELGIGVDVIASYWHGVMMFAEIILFTGLFLLFPNIRKKLLMRKLAYEKNN